MEVPHPYVTLTIDAPAVHTAITFMGLANLGILTNSVSVIPVKYKYQSLMVHTCDPSAWEVSTVGSGI